MIEILPADDDHPPRPDLPVLRHLTFTELHAIELGIYFAFFVYWGIQLHEQTVAFLTASTIVRKIVSDKTEVAHDMGFHDVREEPWYFGSAVVITVIILTRVTI